MATKLSDLSIDDLRAMLRATEVSAGRNSTSARIIRRELQRKLDEQNPPANQTPETQDTGRAAP